MDERDDTPLTGQTMCSAATDPPQDGGLEPHEHRNLEDLTGKPRKHDLPQGTQRPMWALAEPPPQGWPALQHDPLD
jgi:hypothetical protein